MDQENPQVHGDAMENDAPADVLVTRARLATMDGTGDGGLGIVRDGAVVVRDGRIVWAGPRTDLPADVRKAARQTIDAGGGWVTPGLIDCHTHIVHAGDRAAEWAMRLEGRSYEEIARAGGGILSTVKATRAAGEDALVAETLPRLDALLADGVTTVEAKSGYGLDAESEYRMLRAARRLGSERAVEVVTTFLGAHAVPPEYRDESDAYIALVCDEMIPAVAASGLADAVDAFCEGIGFSPDQVRRVFEAATRHGLPVKLHAEQLSDLKGATLAASFGALSADHLEYMADDGIAAMAGAGTVAVLLPGAFYFLGETRKPPVGELRAADVPVAVATDCNPGSSPVASLLTAMNMACVLFGLTPAEALRGVTAVAARALGLGDRGVIEAGRRADLACWDVTEPAALCCQLGMRPLRWAMVWGEVRQ